MFQSLRSEYQKVSISIISSHYLDFAPDHCMMTQIKVAKEITRVRGVEKQNCSLKFSCFNFVFYVNVLFVCCGWLGWK